jgi:LPS-assembly lipoprotein
LKRTLRGSQATRIADRAEDAEAIFKPTGESRERKVITYSSGGRVREVQLIYRYSFSIIDRKGRDLIAPEVITMTRDMSYDEANALAKSAEEDLIWRDMMNDLTQQIMRRLAGTTRGKVLGTEAAPGPVSSTAAPVHP